MDLQSVNTGADVLMETTEIAELSFWQKLMRIELTSDAIRDIAMYILLFVFLCAVSKVIYDLKENRRLKKEFAAYQQRRKDEEQEYGQG